MSKTIDKPGSIPKKQMKGKVHLFILMDESGSMSGKQEAVVTGCNEFLHSFKNNKLARAWLAFFDESPGSPRTRFKIKGKKIADTDKLTVKDYVPRGMTPLNDAILESLSALDKKVIDDETVFMAIITDGLENASESSTEDVKRAIAKFEKKGWAFVYLGANQHAETTASSIGLGRKGQSFNFAATSNGIQSTSNALVAMASGHSDAYLEHGAGVAAAAASESLRAAVYDQTGGVIEEDDNDE